MDNKIASDAPSVPADRHVTGITRVMVYAPLALFALLLIAFAVGLTLNPSEIPSALIGKPVPDFDLPPVEGRTLGLSSDNLKGEVSLVNVFASWCTECRVEHPLWMEISRRGIVPVHGLNYKDQPEDAKQWLDSLGDPFTRTGADIDGRVSIDWGVYGVPETFVVDRNGTIVFKKIGAINRKSLEEEILPLVRKLRETTP